MAAEETVVELPPGDVPGLENHVNIDEDEETILVSKEIAQESHFS
jgi:hypothetical protein